MIEAKEARSIAVKNIRVRDMLRDMKSTVEGCIRNCAANGKMEAMIDLHVLPLVSTDDETKDRVVAAMLSELKMLGYHVKAVENSSMHKIDWREEEESND